MTRTTERVISRVNRRRFLRNSAAVGAGALMGAAMGRGPIAYAAAPCSGPYQTGACFSYNCSGKNCVSGGEYSCHGVPQYCGGICWVSGTKRCCDCYCTAVSPTRSFYCFCYG